MLNIANDITSMYMDVLMQKYANPIPNARELTGKN